MAVAMPALNAAVSALDTLKQQDISLVKAMTSPPAGVRMVMEAICILKVSHSWNISHRLSRYQVLSFLEFLEEPNELTCQIQVYSLENTVVFQHPGLTRSNLINLN